MKSPNCGHDCSAPESDDGLGVILFIYWLFGTVPLAADVWLRQMLARKLVA